MSESSVRSIVINDPVCPVCLEETLIGDRTGYGGYNAGFWSSGKGFVVINNVEVRSLQTTCSNCGSRVDRAVILTEFDANSGSVTEEVSPSPHGLVIRELRELKKTLKTLEVTS